MRILVVDDEPSVRDMLLEYLRHAGYEVEAASSGDEALAALRKGDFEAVVADAGMPQRDGFLLCQSIRVDPSLKHLGYILYSGRSITDADRQFARRIGADAYVSKGDGPKTLLRTIVNLAADGRPNRKAMDMMEFILEHVGRVQAETQQMRQKVDEDIEPGLKRISKTVNEMQAKINGLVDVGKAAEKMVEEAASIRRYLNPDPIKGEKSPDGESKGLIEKVEDQGEEIQQIKSALRWVAVTAGGSLLLAVLSPVFQGLGKMLAVQLGLGT